MRCCPVRMDPSLGSDPDHSPPVKFGCYSSYLFRPINIKKPSVSYFSPVLFKHVITMKLRTTKLIQMYLLSARKE